MFFFLSIPPHPPPPARNAFQLFYFSIFLIPKYNSERAPKGWVFGIKPLPNPTPPNKIFFPLQSYANMNFYLAIFCGFSPPERCLYLYVLYIGKMQFFYVPNRRSGFLVFILGSAPGPPSAFRHPPFRYQQIYSHFISQWGPLCLLNSDCYWTLRSQVENSHAIRVPGLS